MVDTPGTLEERADRIANDVTPEYIARHRYAEAWAVAKDAALAALTEAADEIASLRARVEAMRRLLDNVGGFLDDFAQADMDEGAADAVTVGMVYQQQAQTVVLPRITQALKDTPVE